MASVLGARRVPCICPEQYDRRGPRGGVIEGAKGVSVGYSQSRGNTIERIVCDRAGCCRTWTRVNVR
jgi:hypothetical protein